MQRSEENILTSIVNESFSKKLFIWKRKASEGDLEMFPLISKVSANDTLRLIIKHLTNLEANIKYYFPSLNTEEYDWIRNSFIEVSLTLTEEELSSISTDGNLKIEYKESSLEKFWTLIREEYQSITKTALAILLRFSTSYLCELEFSTLTNIKCKKRTNLQSIDEEMRVCLSYMRHNIEEIAKTHQAYTSHHHEID